MFTFTNKCHDAVLISFMCLVLMKQGGPIKRPVPLAYTLVSPSVLNA